MQLYFQINHLDRDSRKKMTVKFAEEYLGKFQLYQDLERKLDLGDSMCQLKYFLYLKKTYLRYYGQRNKMEASTFYKNIQEFKYSDS